MIIDVRASVAAGINSVCSACAGSEELALGLRRLQGAAQMKEVVVVQERFRGPPTSGNGGYVSGLLAELLTRGAPRTAAEVTLRSPVPLDQPLAVMRDADGLRVLHAEQLIAEVRLAELELSVPAPPSFEEALAAQSGSLALRVGTHPILPGERVGVHPICFCCGAELARDAGLHVYSAALPGHDLVAAAWLAPPAFADETGCMPAAMIGTALDCPGEFAWYEKGLRFALLGRMTLRIDKAVRASERCVIIGWTIGEEGRKRFAGTALFDAQGEMCASAKAVWIAFG